MKKILLSLGVIGAFVLYSFHSKSESEKVNVVPPKDLNNVSVANPETPTTIPTQTAANPVVTQQQTPPTQVSTPTPTRAGQYRDGTYTGQVADAYYGNIQVKAIISGGKLTDVQFLQYPNDRNTSVMINTQAMPYLKSEAIQAQSANVDIVSGATDSSRAFIISLGSALAQAK